MTPRASLCGAPLAGLMVGLLAAGDGRADTIPPYPPSTCAALWEGYADVLGDEGERALAARFRAASVKLIGATETDALIDERRPWMRDLLAAYVYDQDDQSRDLFERLVTGCGRLEADLPYLGP
ncbi:hypothetical protein [Rubellimicrobium arenae]|uniref:hypothetical protein n=1 Tax=Rubellimicrobium arenae TaxID=2817372 RepID=UPI001B306238|nr:hypothetical protein [Rubellimicrobium arenae]